MSTAKTQPKRAALEAPQTALVFETAAAPNADAVKLLSFDQLRLGKNNPRKSYDPDALRELAESIRVRGILQSLLVRRPAGDKVYDVVAGQRRYRAAEILVKDGVWKADEPRFPVHVEESNEAEALLAAIIENNQRENINPMDEAEGFARLQKADPKYTNAFIAGEIGRTTRYVQKRVALTVNLDPDVQKALRAGDITTAQASAIAIAPTRNEQKEVLRSIKNGWGDFETEADIRSHFMDEKPVLANAIFPLALYTGEVMVDDIDETNNRAAEAVLFERLQREAVDAKRAELEAAGTDVVVLDAEKNQSFYEWEWTKAAKDGTTVIELRRSLEVKIRHNLKRKAERASSSSGSSSSISSDRSASKKKSEPWTKTHLALCHRVKSAALQRAVAGNALTAMRLIIASLLDSTHFDARDSVAAFGTKDRALDDHATAPELLDSAAKILAKVGVKVSVKHRNEDFAGTNAIEDNPFESPRKPQDLWPLIEKLSPLDVETLFAALVASRVGTFNGWQAKIGDQPFPLALAKSLKVNMANQPNPVTEAWLAAARKPQLLELIADCNIGADCNVDGKGIHNMTQSALRAAILALVEFGAVDGYVPRTLRFGTAAELALNKPAAKPKVAKKSTAKKKAKTKPVAKKTKAKKKQ